MVDGVLTVDGVPLDEPYALKRSTWNYAEVTVGGDEYFVVGDNRSMKVEHHDFGRARRERVQGRIVW